MFKFKLLLVICSFVAIISASPDDELKKDFTDVFIECMADYPLSEEDLENLKKDLIPTNTAAKCLFACAFKKTGMMDEKGYLSVEGVHSITKKYYSHNPEMIKKSEEFTDICKRVNDESMADGEAGCERAVSLIKCSIEKAPEFGFT